MLRKYQVLNWNGPQSYPQISWDRSIKAVNMLLLMKKTREKYEYDVHIRSAEYHLPIQENHLARIKRKCYFGL